MVPSAVHQWPYVLARVVQPSTIPSDDHIGGNSDSDSVAQSDEDEPFLQAGFRRQDSSCVALRSYVPPNSGRNGRPDTLEIHIGTCILVRMVFRGDKSGAGAFSYQNWPSL